MSIGGAIELCDAALVFVPEREGAGRLLMAPGGDCRTSDPPLAVWLLKIFLGSESVLQ
jgi:hypothetical protein